jgi:hypothetical protein
VDVLLPLINDLALGAKESGVPGFGGWRVAPMDRFARSWAARAISETKASTGLLSSLIIGLPALHLTRHGFLTVQVRGVAYGGRQEYFTR